MFAMKALLLQAATPPTYWGYQHSLTFVGKAAALPPLGLATLAAHLPDAWELRLHDLNLGPVDDEAIRWADAVLVSGMLAQQRSIRETLGRAARLGRPAVLGGPAPTTSPGEYPEATWIFRGEAEGRLDRLVRALERPGAERDRVLSPPDGERPDLALARVPRFDLLALDRYASASIQVSRGCPFTCEFCDIIEVFGRVPRVKAPAQVLAELDALHRLGARGPLFVVDDNFIGNRRAIGALLPRIAEWQRARGRPYDLYTEASVDLAAEPALVAAMTDAGFTAVFVGLETPDPETLARVGKKQNTRRDPAAAVESLTRAGLEVFAGFIVGFDGDDAAAIERQRAFVAGLPIPRAMVGMLSALPGTALWRRLEREGRLRGRASGDQFDGTNFEPTMGEEALAVGYRDLLASLFSPEGYYGRCERLLELSPPRDVPVRDGLGTAWRALWRIGIAGPRRRWFWRLLRAAAPRGRSAVVQAVTLAVLGEHFVRYTEEEVLPRLDRRIAEIRAEAAARPAAAPPARRAAPAEGGRSSRSAAAPLA